jgi:hypothetical protein
MSSKRVTEPIMPILSGDLQCGPFRGAKCKKPASRRNASAGRGTQGAPAAWQIQTTME